MQEVLPILLFVTLNLVLFLKDLKSNNELIFVSKLLRTGNVLVETLWMKRDGLIQLTKVFYLRQFVLVCHSRVSQRNSSFLNNFYPSNLCFCFHV